MSLISIKEHAGIPKYKQIVTSVEDGLLAGILSKGDKLPSINKITDEFDLSRDTVMMAFNELKMRGIVEAVSGKGYYIKTDQVQVKQKVFLLFDELNGFKEDLYNAFLDQLDDHVQVDIFFHHFSVDVFKRHIQEAIGNYHYYVVMPANLKAVEEFLTFLPQDKVYILDQTRSTLNQYASIYQNFENDMFSGLKEGLELIKSYQKLILVYPNDKQPQGMLKGFKRFVKEFEFPSEIVSTLSNRRLNYGELYVILDDKDLIVLIKNIKEQGFKTRRDIGVISYNDTLLKEIVENGITTISTDFKLMGKKLAEMILQGSQDQVENPNKLIVRNSL